MFSGVRGRAVIIDNMNFENPQDYRYGSRNDAADLRQLFQSLHFLVELHQDLTAEVSACGLSASVCF